LDFPRTVDEITPEWLTQVLRESGAISGARVESFKVSNVGDSAGVAGLVSRLELAYDIVEPEAPTSVIIKQAVADGETRALVAPMNHIEVQFYKHLAVSSGVRTPRSYFSDGEEESGYAAHVFEDMSGLRSVNQADDIDVGDARAALEMLAGMHARWWNSPQLSEYPWLRRWDSPPVIEWINDIYAKNLEGFFKVGSDRIPDGIEKIVRDLEPTMVELLTSFARQPVTLVHGDFKPANLFFDDSGHATEVVAFDWSNAGCSKAAVDLAHFIGLGFSTETRRTHELKLLTDYHDALVDLGVSNYSFDQFIEHFRLGLLIRLPFRMTVIASMGKNMTSTDEGRKTFHSMIDRLQTLIDWNCDEVIPK